MYQTSVPDIQPRTLPPAFWYRATIGSKDGRRSYGAGGGSRGGAHTLRQVWRGAIASLRAGVGWGGDPGGHRTLRRRGRGDTALHLWYRRAGGGWADPLSPGQLSRGPTPL